MGIHIGATKGQKYRGKKLLRAPADGTGVVEERNERTGQIKCRLSGAAVNLGIWWLDAAMRGALPSLSLINRVPTFQQQGLDHEWKNQRIRFKLHVAMLIIAIGLPNKVQREKNIVRQLYVIRRV